MYGSCLIALLQIEHFPEGTSLRLDEGERIKCRLLVDCSGHKSELVERSGVDNPGVQIAYGVEVEVKGDKSGILIYCSLSSAPGWVGDVTILPGGTAFRCPKAADGMFVVRKERGRSKVFEGPRS